MTRVLQYGRINDMPRGWQSSSRLNYSIYRMWQHMFMRCYSENRTKKDKSYIGCIVCKEWFYLSNFLKWLEQQPSYKDFEILEYGYSIDKDMILEGNNVYCPEYCTLVTKSENSRESALRNRELSKAKYHPKSPVIGISKDNKTIFLFKGFNEVTSKGFTPRGVRSVINKEYHYTHGFKFYRINFTHSLILRVVK